ncbi:MAG: YggS family pyridoxal phosphate-dependent enzyme [Firmicutes bacterium]|nr:YggS family pyridoxal phosphate-dependent enzyme [Bacillota bacterium]
MSIQLALQQVRQNILLAQEKSPYAMRGEVKLLAVSKTQPVERIAEACHAGQKIFAENRVQELVEKQQVFPNVSWHLIGHLQTNKVRHIVNKIELLHSLESIGLADELQKRLSVFETVLPVLIQVNIAEEQSKYGLAPNEVSDFLDALADFPALQVQGLMTIGPLTAQGEEIRPIFRELRRLLQQEKKRYLPHTALHHLSMGMSGDYMIAVEEGATMVRVGSSIFGARSVMYDS